MSDPFVLSAEELRCIEVDNDDRGKGDKAVYRVEYRCALSVHCLSAAFHTYLPGRVELSGESLCYGVE